MSTYIMTDIHGHYDAMKTMLDKIGFSSNDQLICAGDYIDRGPKSYEMLKWIESPGENVILVRGNHDEEFRYYVKLMKMIYAINYLKNMALSGGATGIPVKITSIFKRQ